MYCRFDRSDSAHPGGGGAVLNNDHTDDANDFRLQLERVRAFDAYPRFGVLSK